MASGGRDEEREMGLGTGILWQGTAEEAQLALQNPLLLQLTHISEKHRSFHNGGVPMSHLSPKKATTSQLCHTEDQTLSFGGDIL